MNWFYKQDLCVRWLQLSDKMLSFPRAAPFPPCSALTELCWIVVLSSIPYFSVKYQLKTSWQLNKYSLNYFSKSIQWISIDSFKHSTTFNEISIKKPKISQWINIEIFLRHILLKFDEVFIEEKNKPLTSYNWIK